MKPQVIDCTLRDAPQLRYLVELINYTLLFNRTFKLGTIVCIQGVLLSS